MSLIYESEEITRDKLEGIRKRNICAICSGWLNMFFDAESGKAFIACHEWPRSQHQGIMRPASEYEKKGFEVLTIEARRDIMEQEHGTRMTTALEKARIPTTGALTQPQAMHILKLVYPKAPEDEIIRCALLCRDFGLHPLMKEVFLIPFNEGKPNESWVTVLGIVATRKLVSQRGTYSYLDNTPRVMTESEQVAIFGEVDSFCIVAITKLKTRQGEEAQGYGRWPKNTEPKGMGKGNTKANMAFIRSERNAFGRLFSDSLPQGVEVVDEAYVEVPDVGKVSTVTGEITELDSDNGNETSTEPTPGVEEHWCSEHNCAFELKKGKYGEFYAHKTDSGWCNEKKKKEKKSDTPLPEQEALPGQEPQEITASDAGDDPDNIFNHEPVPGSIDDLLATMALCNWSQADVGHLCNTYRKWNIKAVTELSPEQLVEVIAHIKNNAK